MKLDHIYKILKDNKDNLKVDRKRTSSSPSEIFQISDVQSTIKSIKEIDKLNVFESLNDFKSNYHNFYSWSEDNYSDSGNITSRIVSDLNTLHREVNSILNILDKFIPKDEGYIISVKLPQYESLNDLPKFYKELDTMLTPLIDYFGDDTLTIHSFENGSIWNDFLVTHNDTIIIILTFLSTGMTLFSGISQIRKDKVEMEKAYLEIQQIKDAKSMPDDVCATYKFREDKEYNNHINQFIQILKDKQIEVIPHGRTEDEIRTIIKYSFKSYQTLLEDGTEFYGKLDEEDEDLNKLVDQLDTSQKLLIHQRKLELLSENSIKSLTETTSEEIGTSDVTDIKDND